MASAQCFARDPSVSWLQGALCDLQERQAGLRRACLFLVFPTRRVSGKESLRRPCRGWGWFGDRGLTACAVGYFQSPLPGLGPIVGGVLLRRGGTAAPRIYIRGSVVVRARLRRAGRQAVV